MIYFSFLQSSLKKNHFRELKTLLTNACQLDLVIIQKVAWAEACLHLFRLRKTVCSATYSITFLEDFKLLIKLCFEVTLKSSFH